MADPIAMLITRKGLKSLRGFAKELKISPVYLSNVLRGKQAPGPKILKALGLAREQKTEYKRQFEYHPLQLPPQKRSAKKSTKGR